MEPTNWNSGSYQTTDTNAEFTRISHTISGNVQKISQNATSINRMAAQIGTSTDAEQLRQKLHETQHYTLTLSRDTSELLKQLTNLPPPSNHDDQRQHKITRERLTNDFSTVLNNFQSIQRTVTQKEKASIVRARAETAPTYDEEVQEPTTMTHQQRLQIEQNVDLQTLREREQAIRQLESDIGDVNQIFKDLALMIHEHGEMIDSIEANVDSAQIHVEQGASQIAQAARYQSSARKKKLICFIVLLLAIVILILIIYFTTKS